MGIFKHGDDLSTKWTTAIITDATNRLWYVPIKHTLGEFFIAHLDNTFYAFSMRGARQVSRRHYGAKHANAIMYDTTHYRPIGAWHKELELLLTREDLPRLNRTGLDVLRSLAGMSNNARQLRGANKAAKQLRNAAKNQDATTETTPIGTTITKQGNLIKLINKLGATADQYPERRAECDRMVQYIKNLDRDEIVTPLGQLPHLIHEDLRVLPANFLGEMKPHIERMNQYRDHLANTPNNAMWPWTKVSILGGIIALLGLFIFIAYDAGWFESFAIPGVDLSGFGGIQNALTLPVPGGGTVSCTDAAIQARYPEPLDLKLAIANGTETCPISEALAEIMEPVEIPEIDLG